HHGLGDDGDVVLVWVGQPRAAGDPYLRHLRRPWIDRDVVELVVPASVARGRLGQEQRDRLDDLVRPPTPLLDARAGHLVLPRIPSGADAPDEALVTEMAQGRDLLRQHHGMTHRQHEDAGRDLYFRRDRSRIRQHVERLEPGVALDPPRSHETIDDPDVDAVFLALLDGLVDAARVLRPGRLIAPRIRGNPCAELELGHAVLPGEKGLALFLLVPDLERHATRRHAIRSVDHAGRSA